MNDDSFNPNEEADSIHDRMQKWIDAEFLCPKCKSANNVIKLEALMPCFCTTDCTVQRAMVNGQCNNCGINLIGIVEVQEKEDGHKYEDVKHGIEMRWQKHANN